MQYEVKRKIYKLFFNTARTESGWNVFYWFFPEDKLI